MPSGCSVRAVWILSNSHLVLFSRRFPVVERRWREAWKRENDSYSLDELHNNIAATLPTDSELAAAVGERRKIEGSVQGFGVRVSQSAEGSDSWIDDPMTRYIIGLHVKKEEVGDDKLLWPLVLHIRGQYCILILPLVEPKHVISYARLCKRSDCGNSIGGDSSLSSLLLNVPSITGSLKVAHAIGDIATGDVLEPEVVMSASPSVGGLLDSLTGSIGISGISSRAKPGPVASAAPSSTAASGAVTFDVPRPLDKDAVRSFISSSLPFGTPLDLSYSNIFSIKINGFSSLDLPPTDLKQPAWKPYLHKGKQRVAFTLQETIHAAMYDRDEIPDSISISGQINCRVDLEGLPDVSFPMAGLSAAHVEGLSFHPCVQVPQHGVDKHAAVMFSPPLGNFILMRYQASCAFEPPIKGFYQLSMVSEDKGAFLFKLSLMEGYKSLTMEFCTVTMPFPRRRIVSFDGIPSTGTVSTSDHVVEWKIIMSGRGLTGKSLEATFPGTIMFAPWQRQRLQSSISVFGNSVDDDSDLETESTNNVVNFEEFLNKKMNKDLPAVDLEEPFSWHAYNYAKVSFKIVGASLSGTSIDPKSVSIYPAVKAPVELSSQVDIVSYLSSEPSQLTFLCARSKFPFQIATSGDYILWNTLGKCPSVATKKV